MTPRAIRTMRKDLEWTQTQLAAYLGVTLRTVQNYEAGNVVPKPAKQLLKRLREDPPARPPIPRRRKRRRRIRP